MKPQRDNHQWTLTERESLRRAAADFTLRWSDIGELLGRTGHACRVEAAKQGFVPRAKLRQKIDGVATAQFKYVPPRQPREQPQVWTKEEEATLRADWANPNLDRADIVQKLGRSDQAIIARAYKMRLGRKARHAARPTLKPAEPARLSADYVAELLRRGISQETINMMGRK